MSEVNQTQTPIRLEAARRGWLLMRNNSGAVTTDDGRHIRFGLGNDSAAVNARIKSSDLIGIHPVTITPDMVGQTIGVFVGVECKAPGWKLRPGDKRGQAQARFGDLVRSHGGVFQFATSVEDVMW